MAGENYTWQVSAPNIDTGKGRVSSFYNDPNGESPLTTITTSNPDGFVEVNPLSKDPIVSKTDYKIDKDGAITYRYTGPRGGVSTYDSIQDLIDNTKSTPSQGYQIKSAVQSTLVIEARQKNVGQAPIASLPSTAAVPGTGPVGNQVGTLPPPEDTTVDLSNLTQINPDEPNKPFSKVFGSESLVYPTNIRNNGQDFIKFTAVKYVPRKLDVSGDVRGPIGVLQERGKLTDILGNIILPIQPSISDSNSVDWNGLGINPIEMELTTAGLNLMSGNGSQYVNNLISRLGDKVDDNTKNAIKLYFAQKAAGTEGLLSRVAGAVVNPNLELLFQGPTLRPFNFTFRLSPRDLGEATQVRKIIRAFKQYSAVGTASGGLFLTAPNIFNIQYVTRRDEKEEDHKSLNKIKTCALKSVGVDYTPDGSYMTFNDNARTMTSYSLSLQFQELEPVTTKDYNMSYDHIGY
jgi:hypothetical protein